jgi:hypothetical protein
VYITIIYKLSKLDDNEFIDKNGGGPRGLAQEAAQQKKTNPAGVFGDGGGRGGT